MFFPRRERKYRDDGTHNVVENEEENSINASFHCSAMRQLFRTDRVYSYLHVDTHDCKIANFYFHSLFYSKLMFARCVPELSNCEYLVVFFLTTIFYI